MKTKVIFQNRTHPVTTERERRDALSSLGEAHPVLLALQDELAEQLINATDRTASRSATLYDSGYQAAVLDLSGRINELRTPQRGAK